MLHRYERVYVLLFSDHMIVIQDQQKSILALPNRLISTLRRDLRDGACGAWELAELAEFAEVCSFTSTG